MNSERITVDDGLSLQGKSMSYFGYSRTRYMILAVLMIAALLAGGCGSSRRKARREAQQNAEATLTAEAVAMVKPAVAVTPEYSVPAPPAAPALFTSFDSRAYKPDRLLIPSIELDTPVRDLGWSSRVDESDKIFSEWDVAAYAAGWHKNSAQLGEGGNVVMSGHNNIFGAVFRELDQLKQGNEIEIISGDVRYIYEIDKVMIVPEARATDEQRKDNAHWIAPFDDDRLTLVSCWPRDDNTHRIIVVGHRTGEPEFVIAQPPKKESTNQ